MDKKIIWIESKENTIEGYYNEIMYFDINKENGKYAVYEMKKQAFKAMNRPDFDTLKQAKEYCNGALANVL